MIDDTTVKFAAMVRINRYALSALCAVVLGMMLWTRYDVGRIREELVNQKSKDKSMV